MWAHEVAASPRKTIAGGGGDPYKIASPIKSVFKCRLIGDNRTVQSFLRFAVIFHRPSGNSGISSHDEAEVLEGHFI